MMNDFDGLQNDGQDVMNRTMKSVGALSRGWQALASETAGFSKQSFEEGAEHLETLIGAKSLDVAVASQTDFAKATYERTLGQVTRLGGLYLDALKEMAKPFEGFVPTAAR